jgi:VWFA-related protein
MRLPAGSSVHRRPNPFAGSGAEVSRRRFLLSLGALLPAGLRSQSAAQQAPQEQEGRPVATFGSDVKVVNLFVTVRNKQGQIVRDLKKEDFILEEDGRPQTIRYFSQESDLPLTLGLVVDTSLSQRRVLGGERNACYVFLDEMLRDKDMAFVIHFDREVELLQDLTSSRKQLEAALERLETPQLSRRPQWGGRGRPGSPGPSGTPGRRGVGTTLYDAVFLACDELMKKQSGRKALILLSDGVDMGSKVSLPEAIESAQRADTLVYSILFSDQQAYGSPGGFGSRGGWGGPGMGRRGRMGGGRGFPQPQARPDGKKILERISKETGGALFEVSKKESIGQIFDRIQEELRNQYSLGYSPDSNAGAGYRKIHLTTRQKNLIVQTRDGYYAGA